MKIKAAVVGPQRAGKSSLILHLCGEKVPSEYLETWECAVSHTEYTSEEQKSEEERVTLSLNLWQSGALFLRKFGFYTSQLIKHSDLIIYVFSLPSLPSTKIIVDTIKKTREESKGDPSELLVITGKDSALGSTVTEDQIRDEASKMGVTDLLFLEIPLDGARDSNVEALETVK